MLNDLPRLAAALAALSCAGAAHAGSLTVENALAACVDMRPEQRAVADGQVLLRVALDVKQPIGRCGCKSAIAAYTSRAALDGGHRGFLQSGALRVAQSGARALTLASDATLADGRDVVLSLGCAAPD